MSKPVTFTATKVLDYEDWLLVAALAHASLGTIVQIEIRSDLLKELEEAENEYSKRRQNSR
jgi:hypothetical protein